MSRRRPRRSRARRPPRSTGRLGPERLEERALLALTWTGASGTDSLWSDPANWDAGRAPTSGDVLIFADGPAVVSKLATDDLDLTLGGLQLGWSGKVNLARDLAVSGGFAMAGGELTGTGRLTLSGPSSWTGGTMSGTGATEVPVGATLTLDGGANKVLRRHLRNAGTVNWDGDGELLAGSGAVLDNLAGALFVARSDADFDTADSTGGVVNNAGTFRKSGGAGTTTLLNTSASSTQVFNNTGVVDVASGTLDFQDGGSSQGAGNAYAVAAGSRVIFSGYVMLQDTTFRGDGAIRLAPSGVLNVNGRVTATNIEHAGGTLTGAGRFVVSGVDHWTSGPMAGDGTTTILAGASLVIDGPLDKNLLRDLDNAGDATWSDSGPILGGNGATFRNLASGVFDIRGDARYDTSNVSDATLVNVGLLRKSAGSGTTSFQDTLPGSRLRVVNGGTIEALVGTLRFDGVLDSSGAGTLSSGTYHVVATLVVGPSPIATNAAAIVLDGPSYRVRTTSGADALATLATVAEAGTLTLTNGARLATTGALTNAGNVAVLGASVLAVPTRYVQTSGTTRLNGDTLGAAGGVAEIDGGVLLGEGTVAGDLTNAAEVDPGGDGGTGLLAIVGDYRQTSSGSLNVELAGRPASALFDRMIVSGWAYIDGTLRVLRLDGFLPSRGDRFNVLGTGPVRGHFAMLAGLILPAGQRLDAFADPSGFELVASARSVVDDFDGDGKTDLAVYRPSTAQWFIQPSGGGVGWALTFGAPNLDIPVPADYDGDGRTDLAVYRPSTAQWFILGSSAGPSVITFGAPGLDLPVAADYDGDGRADVAVYRPTTAQWFVLGTASGRWTVTFGAPNRDRPVPADYDGDGKADVATYRSSTAQWFLSESSSGPTMLAFGAPDLDVPIPADYDGDGRADVAVYRPTTAQWFLQQSSDGPRARTFGAPLLDVPILADFDGDGRTDLAVYRGTAAEWFIAPSDGETGMSTFGAPGTDIPLPTSVAYRTARVRDLGRGTPGWRGY